MISDSNFPICGFHEYSVSIVKKVEEIEATFKYPQTEENIENCNTLTSCNLIEIDTADVTMLIVTISARTFQAKTVSTSFDLQIVECSSKSSVVIIDQVTEYNQVVLYEALSVTKGFYIPEFSSSNIYCPISSIELVDDSGGLEF